ncbi:MAG: excinuclease ABC subunit B, partial [Gammaproteobacteria bacterium]
LDMPEVALVAILDADKEGFLRSDRSLIQTIGRAARNACGRAILYADKVTGSMQRAMDETARRREKQEAFNAEHGIVPKTIIKGVVDVMEGARLAKTGKRSRKGQAAIAEEAASYASAADISREMDRLEKAMHEHARNLEFEEAASLRDRLAQLRERWALMPGEA